MKRYLRYVANSETVKTRIGVIHQFGKSKVLVKNERTAVQLGARTGC